MRSLVVPVFLVMCGCATNGKLTLATPTPGETATPTPTPTPDPCTLAGTVCVLGTGGSGDGGPALQSSLSWPYDVALDQLGNLFIADTWAHRIRKIDSNGVITTIAGTGHYEWPVMTGLPATGTPVNYPTMIAAGGDGWVYWANWNEPVIYGLDPATGYVVLIAGNDTWDVTQDGPATEVPAYPGWQGALATDGAGNLYIAVYEDHVVRVLNRQATDITVTGIVIPPGELVTIAGTGTAGSGANNVQATASALNFPSDVIPRPDGTVIIADTATNRIRRIAGNGIITTIAGTGAAGSAGDGGLATAATFDGPQGIAVDMAGRLFVADDSMRVRLVNYTGADSTWGGVDIATNNVDTIGGGTWANFIEDEGGPAVGQGVTWDHGHPVVDANGDLVFADAWTGTVRKIHSSDGSITVMAGLAGETGVAGYQQWVKSPAFLPNGQLVYGAGTPYLFAIDPVSGARTTIAGTGETAITGEGGPAVSASAYASSLVTIGGTIVFTDSYNLVIRQIDAAGIISTIAGSGAQVEGGAGNGGPATAAAFDRCEVLTADAAGNLFVLDDDQVRFVNRGATPLTVAGVLVDAGEIERIAGTPNTPGDIGDGGPALSARLDTDYQTYLLVANGGLFISDFRNARIRRVDLATGIITTFAGTGDAGWRGDGDLPSKAWTGYPTGLATRDGFLYWAQEDGAAIRRTLLTGAGPVETVIGDGFEGFAQPGATARETSFLWPTGIAFDANGTLFFGDGTKRIFRVVVP